MNEAIARNQTVAVCNADSASACHAREGRGTRRLSFYSLAKLFFCLFILLKPLYLLPSGSLQVGDVMIVLSLVCLIAHKGMSFRIERDDLPLVAFVLCVIVINSCYFAFYGSFSFLLYTLYYVFNLFTVLMLRQFIDDGRFLSIVVAVVRATLIVQVAARVLGLGDWYDADRYMGTFNDPNQLGFFVLSSFLFIKIVESKTGLKHCYLDDVMAIFLIVETASTAMLLSIAVYYAGRVVHLIVEKNAYRWIVLAVCIVCLVPAVAWYVTWDGGTSVETGNETVDFAIGRVLEKVEKVGAGGGSYSDSLLLDRNWDKLVEYPQMLLYGAGEGEWERFELAYAANEVHSTILGLLFYYGVVPFAFLVAWVIRGFKRGGVDSDAVLLYLPLFFECLFLANQRQPILWIILVAAAIPRRLRAKEEFQSEKEEEEGMTLKKGLMPRAVEEL